MHILSKTMLATLAVLPVAAQAQQLPNAAVAVVDTDRITQQCTVCVTANQQLQTQLQQLQQRADQLGQPLQTEEQALTTAVKALGDKGKPDAALQQRIQTFQTNQANAQREIAAGQQTLQRNAAFVRQQIIQRIEPAITQVMKQRGANIAVDSGATLQVGQAIEVTDAVLAIVNQNTNPLNTVAPPPQQQPAAQPTTQQPQGR